MAGVFKEAVLTAKGIALLAKAQAGRCTIKLTKAATGDGSYSDGEALTNRTALKSKKQEFALITVTTQNQSNVYVKFIITNKQDTDYGRMSRLWRSPFGSVLATTVWMLVCAT